MRELGILFALLVSYSVGVITAFGLVLLFMFFAGKGTCLSLLYSEARFMAQANFIIHKP